MRHNCFRILIVAILVGMPAQFRAASQADAGKAAIQERLNRVSSALFSRAGRVDDAIRELKAILAVDPGAAEGHFLLGIAYRMLGAGELMAEAVAELRQALALNPGFVPARFYLAQLYLDLGRAGRAREELDAALAQVPGNPQFLAMLGEAERQLKNPSRSVQLIRQALQADESNAQARYYLGLALFDLGQRDEAIRELERVVQSGPKVGEAYVSLGAAYLEAGRVEEALEVLTKGTHIDPVRPDIRIQMARAYRSKGLLDKADEHLKIAMPQALGTLASPFSQQQQVEFDLYMELGLLRLQQRQLEAAADAFQKVLEMDPNHGPTTRHLADVRKQLRERLRKKKVLFVPFFPSDQAKRDKSDFPARFVDVTARAKIDFLHKSGASPDKYMVETFGSGVAWIDYDNDGFSDLYFVNGAPGAANALYRNNRDGTFKDVTEQAGVAGSGNPGYKTGVAVGDYDNNGYLDLYVTAFGPNILYRNNGNGTFTDVTAAAGVAGGSTEWSTSTGFFDLDRDGNLDLYVVNYLDYRLNDNPYCGLRKPGYRMYCLPTLFDGMADRLFRNNGNGTFTDVSRQAGIANPAGKGLGVTFCDFDRDGDTDVYIANDMVRNFLYRNNGDGTFLDVAYGAGVGFDINGKPQAGMGVDCADVDGNGRPDIFVTNFSEELNTLYQNQGDGIFEDVSEKVGLGSGYIPLGFGTKMFDFDNDGDLDIHVTNGHVIDNVKLYQPSLTYAQKDLLYENVGGRFRDVSAQSGPALQAERVGRGLAVADFDNDGNLDVVISSLGQRPVLLRNQGVRGGNWLLIRAQGRKSNSFGLGATVQVETADGRQAREINNVASYLSSNDIRLHFGLGAAKAVQRIEILWPSGTKQVLEDIAVNQILVVKEP